MGHDQDSRDRVAPNRAALRARSRATSSPASVWIKLETCAHGRESDADGIGIAGILAGNASDGPGDTSAGLSSAQQDGILEHNLAAIAEGPRLVHKKGRTLTIEEAKTLLRAVKGQRLEAAYVMALMLGLRRGEVLGLRWEDVEECEGPSSRRSAISSFEIATVCA